MLLSGRSDYELLQQLLKPSSRYWDQQHVLNPTGRPMRLSILEPGTTRAQFADSIKEISDETVTEQMLDNLFDKFDEDGDGQLSDVECQHVNRLLIVPLNRLRTALIVVDFQNDFVTGSLAIKNGSAGEDPSEALVPLNRLLAECPFTLIVYTMDWHPYNHISFWEHCRNSDRKLCDEDRARKLKPYDVVHFETPKKLYPTHCVQNSWGADLDSQLIRVKDSVIIKKGTQTYVDSYSAFKDNNKERRRVPFVS
ncbi:Pyrazinamidase/nicotinamidase [Toxocara canis]|uniref:Pyrazinamidase/nicotinamidase n=1 Tax=Toxocara canis TaxID=6265 RepID=A0A0B2V7M9_TOXCA|nr:Pyrazinamidase/nicotinamidase [Toxocara canis]